jgi:hypothetical protein
VELFEDAKFAWDRLQTRVDDTGPNNTNLYYYTRVGSNENLTKAASVELLPTFYAMYKITNDSYFLDRAWLMFLSLLDNCQGSVTWSTESGKVLFGYDWQNDLVINSYVGPITYFVPFAFEDPRFTPHFEELVSGSHELFWSPINLMYGARFTSTGEITDTNVHITWKNKAHKQISQLLWMYELTQDLKYKQWADETIEAIWSLRSPITNLLPRMFDAVSGEIIDPSIAHYDMAAWLTTIELAYYLHGWNNSAGTGVHTYLDIITKSAQAISNYMWHSSQRWGYKTTYTMQTQNSDIPEMNSIYVDYAMILASEITQNEEFRDKALIDFDNEFMGSDPVIPNGVLMSNSLIVHSPNTFKTQSQFSSASNIEVARVANLLYLHTREMKYLEKAAYHYKELMSKHRFSKGYADMIDTVTEQPYPSYNGNPANVFDLAPIEAILGLQNAIIPSTSVFIDWGYGVPTSLPNTYGAPGAFMGVSVDLESKAIRLDSVTSDSFGTIDFSFSDESFIEAVKMDQQPYDLYNGNILECSEGTHSYLINFDTNGYTYLPNSTITFPSTTRTTTTSKPSTENPSTSTSVSTASSSTTSSNNSIGFTYTNIIWVLALSIVFFRRLKKK